MKKSYFEDVAEFHQQFFLPLSAEAFPPSTVNSRFRTPQIPSAAEVDFRGAFMLEEIREFFVGYGEKDLAKMADALVDLVWVALGTAHYMGVPFDALWDEVKRANMEKRPWKEGDPLKPRNALGLEIVKPEGWKPPDIAGVITEFRRVFGFKPDDFVLDEGAFGGDLDPYSPGAQGP